MPSLHGAPTGEPAARGLSAFAPLGVSARELGASGIVVSPLAFGAWGIGGGWGTPLERAEARRVVERALDVGITLFDTAPTYGDGASEATLGDALGRRRDEVVIATKCGPRDDPRASLERSLRRLRTDRVDLYQLHEVPAEPGLLERQLEVMRALAEEGLVRAIGLCNANAAQLARALAVAPLASHQAQYNLLDRDAERDTLPLALTRGVAFLAYRPLASGLLSGKFQEPPRFEAGDHRNRIYWFRGREFERRRKIIDRLQAIARERELTLPQLALAWALARPSVTAVLAGARTVAQVGENAGSLARPLDSDAIAAIDAVVAAAYTPRALRRDVRVSDTPSAAGEHQVTVDNGSTPRSLSVGAREAYVMRQLDGRTSYAEIADGWAARGGERLLTAQVVLLVDQLADLGLLEDAHE